MRKPRHLSPEERALWDKVAHRTVPLHPHDSQPADHGQQPAPKKPKVKHPATAPLHPFRVGEKADVSRSDDLMRPVAERLAGATVQMDHKSYAKMKRGKLKPEATLDLHGMTLAEAHPELIAFVLASHALGRRLVLVITGKGKDRDDGGPIPTRLGVLRHQVPRWLALPPLAPVVLQVTPAHLRHGGHGAYYVYLRRGR